MARLFLFFLFEPFVSAGQFNDFLKDGEEAIGAGVANEPLTIADDAIFS
jgi:hypothetical protein